VVAYLPRIAFPLNIRYVERSSTVDKSHASGSDPGQLPSLSWEDCRWIVESVVSHAIFTRDASGRIAIWNFGAEKIKDYTRDEIVGEHFSKFYTAEDVAAGAPVRALQTAASVGRVENEGWRVRKDGSRFWAHVVITALRDERAPSRLRQCHPRSDTSKGGGRRARRVHQRFQHLVDAVIDYAIFMLDADGLVATWNAGAHRVKGYAAPEIIGKHFSTFYTAEDRAAGKPAAILDVVRREGRFEEESRHHGPSRRRRKPERLCQGSSAPPRWSTTPRISGCARSSWR
jgi:PAS domain S-box-containing protein